jgi:hypothetical protein
MKNLIEEIQKIKKMMGIISEDNNSRNNLITESIEGKRCWYYKKMSERGFEVNPGKIPNLYEGAYQVQRFLNYIGYNISKDSTFGNETSTSLGTWAYGKSKGINTVDKLWQQMKNDGWDVGETTGYGGKMVKAVADMIVQLCKSLAKTCKVDQQTLFDMEFELLQPHETECRNNLDKQFKRAIKYWKSYLDTPEFKERIKNKNPNIDNSDIVGKVYDKLFNFYWGLESKDKYSLDIMVNYYKESLKLIKGWVLKPNMGNATMTSTNPISVNEEVHCKKYNYEMTYYTFVHEIQHILSGLPLNDWDEVKKAYPLSTDSYSDKKSKTKSELGKKQIPLESKNELINNGINYEILTKWASDEFWLGAYWCDREEKMSNLSNFRAFLVEKGEIKIGGDIPVKLFTKYLKKYIVNPEDKELSNDTNFEQIIVCWAQNNFTPKLSVFISELNSLAKENGDQNKKPYTDINRIDKTEIT